MHRFASTAARSALRVKPFALTSPLARARPFSAFTRSQPALGFLSDYDEHVQERATSYAVPIAPKPLDAAQVSDLIEEVKVSRCSG